MVRILQAVPGRFSLYAIAAFAALLAAIPALGDQVETKNGDRYIGKVLSLNADILIIQTDAAGTLRLPRSKISLIQLGTNNVIRASALPSSTQAISTNKQLVLPSDIEGALALPGWSGQSPAALLEGASPEARAKFNQMMTGLLSGSITTEDVRKEARTVANQVRAMRSDLGPEAGEMLDGYLAILDRFTGQSPSASPSPALKPTPPRAP